MDCQQVRAALSARLDGESADLPDDVVDAHVSGCDECRRWYSTVAALGRELTIGVAGERPDPPVSGGSELAAKVIARAASSTDSLRRRQYPLLFARLTLVVLAVVYFGWACVLLFGTPLDDELARFIFDAATVRFALGVGLLWAALRPKAATAVLPIYLALWAFGAGFATRDIVLGLSGQQTSGGSWGTLVLNLAAVIALLVCWLGRHHMFTPLSQSWRTATAQPIRFSSADLIRNSTYRAGDRDYPEDLSPRG